MRNSVRREWTERRTEELEGEEGERESAGEEQSVKGQSGSPTYEQRAVHIGLTGIKQEFLHMIEEEKAAWGY